jgi:DNA-binding response OmpR family regulator
VSNTYLSIQPPCSQVEFLKTTEDRVLQRKIMIFLVDDEKDISLVYKKGLEQNGFLVDVFNDPVQALLSFRAGQYDLLLLDIKMPKMNGFELYREIQKIDDKVKASFISAFVTYYESLREIFDMRNIHCIIKKPIEMSNLIERIITELAC